MGATINKTKSVEVDVDFDVDIEDFDTDDLVDELICRLNDGAVISYTYSRREALKVTCKEILSAMGVSFDVETIELKSIQDEIKYAHIAKVFDKYSIEEIERLLPE